MKRILTILGLTFALSLVGYQVAFSDTVNTINQWFLNSANVLSPRMSSSTVAVTSTLYSGQLIVASSTSNHSGLFSVDNIGNVSASGTLKIFGSTNLQALTVTSCVGCGGGGGGGGGSGGNNFFSATSSFVRPLTVTDGVTTSSLYANQFNVATSTTNNLGLFGVDPSGNVSVSGTLRDFSLATLLGGFISNASSSINNSLQVSGNLSASSTLTLGGTLIPSGNNSISIGNYNNAFANIYSSSTIFSNNITGKGTLTFGGLSTFNGNVSTTLLSTTGVSYLGGDGGVSVYSMGSGVGTIGFNSTGYTAGVNGFGGLFQLPASTGVLTYFSEDNVSAGVTHAHITAFSVNSSGLMQLNQGFTSNASSSIGGGLNVNGNLSASSSITIASNFLPSINNNSNIGANGLSFANIFSSGTIYAGNSFGASGTLNSGLLSLSGQNGNSYLTGNTFTLGSATNFSLGKFYVDSSGDTFASGTLQSFSLATFLGGFISNASSSVGAGLQVAGNISASSSITIASNFLPSINNNSNIGAFSNAFAKLFASSTVSIGGGQGTGGEGLVVTTDPKTNGDKIFAIRDYLGNDMVTFSSSTQSFDTNNFNIIIKGGTNGATSYVSSTILSSGILSIGADFPKFKNGVFFVDATTGGNGNTFTSGTLQTFGLSTFLSGFISNASSSINSGLQVSGNLSASSTLTLASGFFQTSFTDCSNAITSKVLWTGATGQFSCGTDQTGGGGSFTGFLSSPYYTTDGVTTSTLTANSLYVATSTTNNLGLFNVDSSGNINSSGTLTVLNSNGISTVITPTAFIFAKNFTGYGGGLFNIDPSGNVNTSGSLNISGGLIPKGSIIKPTELLSVGLTSSNGQAIYVSGDYAYITTASDNTVEIYNIASSTALKKVGSYANGVSGSILNNPRRVFVQGNYMYITNSGSTDSLEIADISNPSLPKHIGNIASSTAAGASAPALAGPDSLWVSGKYAYVVATSSQAMVIIDISNPAKPVQKGIIKNGATGYSSSYTKGVNGIQVQGKYAYQCTGNDGLDIFDVSNPASPVFASGGLGNCLNHIGNNTYVLGSYAYVSDGNGNLNIYDVSNPQSEKFVTQFSYNGAQSLSATANYIYMGKTEGLDIIDTSNKLAPRVISSINLAGNPVVRSSFPLGNFIYLLTNSKLYKVDISGASISNLNVGFLESAYFQTNASAKFLQDVSVLGGLSVGGSTQLSSDVSIGGAFASSTPSSSSTIFSNGAFNFGVGAGFNSGVFSLDSSAGNGGNVSTSGTLQVFSTSTFTNILSASVTSTGRVFFNNITAASGNDFLCRSAATGEIIDGGATTCAVSSKRYKHDITDLKLNALETVMKFKTKEYLLNSDNTPHIHFIAEDMFDIDPRLAGVDNKGVVQTIDDDAVLAVLSKAFQDEHIIINIQNDRLKKLETIVAEQQIENLRIQKQINLLTKKQWKKK